VIAGTGERIEVIGVSADAKYTELRAAMPGAASSTSRVPAAGRPGLLTGSALAFGAGRLVASMLFGVTPVDPVTYATVAVLVAVALLESIAPGRRASRIDPVVALKVD
jgi:ABC-type lipoprotein release transport system permease subunit